MELTGKIERFPQSSQVLKVWWAAAHPGYAGGINFD
jgi:hypothetical protein